MRTSLVVGCMCMAVCAGAERVWWVDQGREGASDGNEGTEERPLKTIQAAADRAEAGDTVRVCSGVYRERVSPARGGTESAPIVYEVAPGAVVEVKGSECWSGEWKREGKVGRVYSSAIPLEMFREIPNPYALGICIAGGDARKVVRPVAGGEGLCPRTLGQVFVRGEPLVQVESVGLVEAMEGSWMVSADGARLIVHFPGGEAVERLFGEVEWTVRNRIFAPKRRGLGYIHVKGFRFLHCANQGPFPQGGAVSTRTGRHWLIEGNTIRFAKTVGLDIGSETWATDQLQETTEEDKRLMVQASHVVRDNVISDNGLCGIAGWNSPNVKILNNRLERNNRLHFSTADAAWEEWAAIKLHGSNGLLAGNVIRFNEAHGIWIDNGYDRARITGNVLVGNVGSGVMLELGAGSCLVDHNVIAYTRSYGGFYDGNGVYSHDASGVTVAHNLLSANAGAGVLMRTITERTFAGKRVETSHQRIVNNVFDRNEKGAVCLPYENVRASDNICDWNVYTGEPKLRLNRYQDEGTWEALGVELEGTEGPFRGVSWQVWRETLGRDAHSRVVEDMGFEVLPYRMLMRSRFPEEWEALRVPVVDEMTIDFEGVDMTTDQWVEPLEGRTARPGPFQARGAGACEIPLMPYRWIEKIPEGRLTEDVRKERAGAKRIERAQARVAEKGEGAAGARFSLAGAEGGVWRHGRQEGINPKMQQPLAGAESGGSTMLSVQSPQGVCASPAACVEVVPEVAGRYRVKVAVVLAKRGSASAGYTSVTLGLVDMAGGDAMLVWSQELNTADGYRGGELASEARFEGEVVCPEEYALRLRFQVVAPGPAPAGVATLEVKEFAGVAVK